MLESQAVTRVFYLTALFLVSVHLYRTPIYDMDMLGYMGNALLMRTTDVWEIHRRVYADIDRLPKDARLGLLGLTGSADQNASRRARADHAGNFAEFLPCFAIRPLYNQLLFMLSPFGMIRASVLISVVSYFFLGWLMFQWARKHVNEVYAATASLVLMLTPPLLTIGRSTMTDAPSILIGMFALFLLMEAEQLFLGIIFVLVSIFVRTDNVVLALPTLAALCYLKRIDLWKAGVLSLMAIASVLVINRMAGDYGLAMLYYRNFVGTPVAPAEMTVRFSLSEYISAFRSGITSALGSFLLGFALLGVIGVYRNPHLRTLVFITALCSVLHYLVLPNYQERWFVVFYLGMALSGIASVGTPQQNTFRRRTPSIR